mgnify:CR=1 FL=1
MSKQNETRKPKVVGGYTQPQDVPVPHVAGYPETDVKTSCPKAFSLTFAVKALAVLKSTSAASKALRISFIVWATLISEILPCPLNTLKALSNFSDKFSNIYINYLVGQK